MPLAPNFSGSLVALRFLFGVGGACVVTSVGRRLDGLVSREELPMVNGRLTTSPSIRVSVSPCTPRFLSLSAWAGTAR